MSGEHLPALGGHSGASAGQSIVSQDPSGDRLAVEEVDHDERGTETGIGAARCDDRGHRRAHGGSRGKKLGLESHTRGGGTRRVASKHVAVGRTIREPRS